MGIEAIKGAGMTYQGSVSTAEIRAENQVKIENSQTSTVSTQLARETVAMDTKQTSGDGAGGNGQAANQQAPSNAQIQKAVEDINRRANNSEAVFGIHEATNRITIKIVDKKTKEVIKEFPPEKTLDMIARVWEMAGLMVDEKR